MTITDILTRQRAAFMAEFPVPEKARKDRLTRAMALLQDHHDDFVAAIREDYGTRTTEITLMADIIPALQSLKFARKHVRKWMKPETRRPTFPLGLLGARAWVDYRPKGVVGIISPWNFPVGMIFSPLAGALVAGNRVMIKPSEHVPVTSELTRKLCAKYFAEDEVAVITGGIDVAQDFIQQKFDHLFYTGSGTIGRRVMAAAAENLVPVTLELGGKSPTIVLPDCDIDQAATRIVTGKMANGGQVCVAPDYVFVPQDKLPKLRDALLAKAEEFYPEQAGAPDYTAIINRRQKERLLAYITDARAKGAHITTTRAYAGPTDNILPLHVICDVTDEMRLMQEEIFGPLLPLIPYAHLEEVITHINARPRPLALYILGPGPWGKKLRERIIAGGIAHDEFLLHVGQEDLPFGGTGASGMGHYHGRDGFRTFSHAMSVFKRGPLDILGLLQGRPPFGPRFRAYVKQELKK